MTFREPTGGASDPRTRRGFDQVADKINYIIASRVGLEPTARKEGRAITRTYEDRLYVDDGSAMVRAGWYSSAGRTGLFATRSTDVTIASGASYDVVWEAETQDTDGFHTAGSANIVIPTGLGGLYAVTFSMNTSVAGTLFTQLIFSTRSVGEMNNYVNLNTTSVARCSVSMLEPLAAGDTFVARWGNIAGANRTLSDAWISVYRIGP